MNEDSKTLARILEAARKEFLNNGFLKASLRKIVKEAGVTTGAFYRYYPTKEALFEALVKPHADTVKNFYKEAVCRLEQLPAKDQTKTMLSNASDCMDQIMDYIYSHYDSFKLLVCASDGTVYEDFIHELVALEVTSTYNYIRVLESLGHKIPDIDPGLCHMVASGLFSGIFEMVVHDMDKSEAKKRVTQLREFHTGGWERLFGIHF